VVVWWCDGGMHGENVLGLFRCTTATVHVLHAGRGEDQHEKRRKSGMKASSKR
jgi:hypothetical protein